MSKNIKCPVCGRDLDFSTPIEDDYGKGVGYRCGDCYTWVYVYK